MDIMLNRQQGFTLIEAVMVIIIIAILTVFAFSAWQGPTINLGGQAQQLANDVRYAQSLAMTKGQRYRWVKTSANTYQIQNNAGSAILLAGGTTTATLNSGITFGTLTNLPNNLVNFDGRGTPYSDTATPGTALSADATIPITDSGQTHTITISFGTGQVAVQ